MDDSAPEAEVKSKKLKVKSSSKVRAKVESLEASGKIGALETEARGDGEKGSISSVILEGAQRPIESEEKDAIASLQHDKRKKPQKPGKAKPRSKKYQEAVKDLERAKSYPINEALDLVKKVSYSRFTGTLEVHINTAQSGIRGLVSLPFASGKKLKILAFGKGAEASGADLIGSDDLIEEINKGKLGFDLLVTTPEWMPKLAKIARILGPRGLMPNPKNGTITDDLKKAVESFQAGKTEFKTEPKAPVIHLTLGKLSQPNDELQTNIKTLVQTVGKTRIKKVTLAPTMGPGIKIDLSSLA